MSRNEARSRLALARRVVVKIGSAVLTGNGGGVQQDLINAWSDDILGLINQGIEVALVTSGAVAEGVARLGWASRPNEIYRLQAAAAIGQMGLVQAYESAFARHGRLTAQILLTHADLSHRERYLNARSTLKTLLGLGVVPVINENDTVATEEIRFGDNDTLSALVANLIEADALLLLTDQAGLYDQNPTTHPGAKLIPEVRATDPSLEAIAGGGGAWGRGGMRTKVLAARLAARSGTTTVIAAGRQPEVLRKVLAGLDIGTVLVSDEGRVAARKRWLAGGVKVKGQLHLDAGAVRVLREEGRSLLAVGVIAAEGDFERGELVSCVDPEGREVARGLVNYGLAEVAVIKGQSSDRIVELLGYVDESELIHRDNLVLT